VNGGRCFENGPYGLNGNIRGGRKREGEFELY